LFKVEIGIGWVKTNQENQLRLGSSKGKSVKIKINRESFFKVFQVAAAVAPARSPKAILQNVKLVVSKRRSDINGYGYGDRCKAKFARYRGRHTWQRGRTGDSIEHDIARIEG
jgi:hypothetical protein